MTIIDAITGIDELKANTYTQENKLRWLSTLDLTVKHEIIDTHEQEAPVEFEGYSATTPMDTELLIPAPYDEVYFRWLEAQIDYANGEYGRYNNSITMFNASYNAFANYYNRTHMPIGQKIKVLT